MICSKCKDDKEPCLFAPSEMKLKSPYCRMCRKEQNDITKGRSGKKYKGTEMWRVSMKRHFL